MEKRIPRAIVAFDVDDTLIDKYDEPRRDVLEFLNLFWLLTDADIVVWSGGGVEYAEEWVAKLNLEHKVRVVEKKSIKPDIAIDDFPIDDPYFAPIDLGKVNLQV